MRKAKKGSILYCVDEFRKKAPKRKPRPKVRSEKSERSYNSDLYRAELKRRIRGY